MEKINKKRSKTLCIIQARMGSARLPGKVLFKVQGIPLLEYEVNRVKLSKTIDKIVIATTTSKKDDVIEKLAKRMNVGCFRGSKDDVLDRYYQCTLLYPRYSSIVRITGDCPLIDPEIIDKVVNFFETGDYDYASNVMKERFPDGMDVEVFTTQVLIDAEKNACLPSEREHVTQYMLKNKELEKGNLEAPYDFSDFRLTVDTKEDFEVVKFVIENSKPNDGYMDFVSLLRKNPDIMKKNSHIKRNEGLKKSLKEDRVALRARSTI